MKTTLEIMELINKLENNSKKNDKEIRELSDTITYKMSNDDRDNIRSKIAVLKNENMKIKLKINFLKNNGKNALFNEVMPIAVEVLNKWKNKPYGEKTREKIKNEIFERTGSYVYINNAYYGIGKIVCANHNFPSFGFECTLDKGVLLANNKIQELNMSNLKSCWIKDYIDDIDKEVESLMELYNKALKTQRELEVICDEFNKHIVDGIEGLHIKHLRTTLI